MSTRKGFTERYTQGIGYFDWFPIENLTFEYVSVTKSFPKLTIYYVT
jgi:hypothetical protein